VIITPVSPAAAAGVANPAAISTPQLVSVAPAASACRFPGRSPIDSKN
jgi:hypothetical protein